MITQPSETSALAPFQLDKIKQELTRVYLTQSGQEYIRPTTHGTYQGDFGIFELLPNERAIEAFHMPITFATSTSEEDPQDLIVDIRPFSRTTATGEVVINNPVEYNFNMDVAILTRKWMDNDLSVPEEILLKCWTRWLGTNLIIKLNIEPTLQPSVNIITAYYLYCMLVRQETLIDNPHEMRKVAGMIAKATQSTTLSVYDLLEVIEEPVYNLGGYITALQKYTGSTRFANLTPGFIFSLVQYGWYGAAVIKTCSAAVEFPPIFIAMVYHAATVQGYSKTGLGRILKDLPKSDVDYFSKAVASILYK